MNGVEASLRRLQTDYIDLYYAHEDDPAVPMADSLADLAGMAGVRAVAAGDGLRPPGGWSPPCEDASTLSAKLWART
jgi:hypothetical protein